MNLKTNWEAQAMWKSSQVSKTMFHWILIQKTRETEGAWLYVSLVTFCVWQRGETYKARKENQTKPCKWLTGGKFEEGIFGLDADSNRYRVFCKKPLCFALWLLPARTRNFVYSLAVNRNHWILLSHPSSQVKNICKKLNLW